MCVCVRMSAVPLCKQLFLAPLRAVCVSVSRVPHTGFGCVSYIVTATHCASDGCSVHLSLHCLPSIHTSALCRRWCAVPLHSTSLPCAAVRCPPQLRAYFGAKTSNVTTCPNVTAAAALDPYEPMLGASSSSSASFNTKFNLLYTVYSVPNTVLPFFGGYFCDKLGVRMMALIFTALITVGQFIFALGLSLHVRWLRPWVHVAAVPVTTRGVLVFSSLCVPFRTPTCAGTSCGSAALCLVSAASPCPSPSPP